MFLPFSSEEFLDVFGRYNTTLWPVQIALYGLAGAVVLLALQGGGGRLAPKLLAVLWAWMAIAYHWAFFAEVNPAAHVFGAAFLLQALLLWWTPLPLQARGDVSGAAGGILVLFALALSVAALVVLAVILRSRGSRGVRPPREPAPAGPAVP